MPTTNIGSYAIVKDYTFQCDFTPTLNFCKERLETFMLLNGGTHSFFITRHGFKYFRNSGSTQWEIDLEDGQGVGAFHYYEYKWGVTNTTHTLVVQYDGTHNQLRIYVDNCLLAQQSSVLPAINATWTVETGNDNSFDDNHATLANVSFLTTAIPPTGLLIKPAQQFNPYDTPDGYILGGDASGVADVFTQEALCIRPTWNGGNWLAANVSPLALQINIERMLGWDGTGNTPSQSIIDDAIIFNQLLVDYYGYRFLTISDIESEYQFQSDPDFYMNQYIDYVLNNPPQTGIQLTTNFAFLATKDGRAPVNEATVQYTDPVTVLDNDKYIYDKYWELIESKHGDIEMLIFDDGEGADFGSDGDNQPARTQSGVDKIQYILSGRASVLTQSELEWYDTYDRRFTTSDGRWIDYDVDRSTTGYPIPSFYSRRPLYWWATGGAIRGLDLMIAEKWFELNSSVTPMQLNRPVFGFGFDKLPEINQSFHNALGLCKLIMAGLGADSGYWGFFYEGIAQDGKLWWHYGLALAYTQAIKSFYPQFYTGGATLLDGNLFIDQTTQLKNSKVFWTGSANCILFARKTGTEYLIIAAYMTNTNYIGQPDTYDCTVVIDGHSHDLSIRQHGDIIYWDSDNPSVYEQRDLFHKQMHPTYWADNQVVPIVDNSYGSLNRRIPCGDAVQLAAALALFPTATDDTDPNPVMTENTPIYNPDNVSCPRTITRSWYFTDFDNNVSATFYQTITIFTPNTTMALNLQSNALMNDDGNALLLFDLTGTENSDSWNQDVQLTDIESDKFYVTLPGADYKIGTGTPYEINVFDTLPTIDKNVYFTAPSSAMGQSVNGVMPTGWYRISRTAAIDEDNFWTWTNDFFFSPKADKAIGEIEADADDDECCEDDVCNKDPRLLSFIYRSMCACANLCLVNKTVKRAVYLQKLLNPFKKSI